MQTFLPYPDFHESAKVLDVKRLGKQRVETLQILKGSWPNHPASRMWRGHMRALAEYGVAICDVWRSRGYRDTCREKILELAKNYPESENTLPSWVGDEEFHLSHQSNLLRKSEDHYRKYFPDVPSDLPYIWPTKR